jgi:hypothetical protein
MNPDFLIKCVTYLATLKQKTTQRVDFTKLKKPLDRAVQGFKIYASICIENI